MRQSQIAFRVGSASQAGKSDIANALQRALRKAGAGQLSDLVFRIQGGILTISGSVPSFELKKLVLETAAKVPEILIISDDFEITNDAEDSPRCRT